MRRGAAFAAMATAAAAAVALAGCGSNVKGDHADLVNGKQAFVEKCGSCHALARAGTKGTVGPDLDAAFAQSLRDGFHRDTVESVVKRQISQPALSGKMPAKLLKGQAAIDAAAYVGFAAARPGEDSGALAAAVQAAEQKNAAAKGGKLEIDADPSGQLAYTVAKATAPVGALEIDSKNASSTPHDIAIESDGGQVLGDGDTVSGGGVSKVSVNLKAGTYTFYCSLPGHRDAGMEGTLTVK